MAAQGTWVAFERPEPHLSEQPKSAGSQQPVRRVDPVPLLKIRPVWHLSHHPNSKLEFQRFLQVRTRSLKSAKSKVRQINTKETLRTNAGALLERTVHERGRLQE